MSFKITQENKPEDKLADFENYNGFVRDCDGDLFLVQFDGDEIQLAVHVGEDRDTYLSGWADPRELIKTYGPLRKVDAELIIKG